MGRGRVGQACSVVVFDGGAERVGGWWRRIGGRIKAVRNGADGDGGGEPLGERAIVFSSVKGRFIRYFFWVLWGLVGVVRGEERGAVATARVGWSFDTGLSVAAAKELLVERAPRRPPEGSWLRLRGIELGDAAVVERNRADLAGLRAAGFRLVVFMRWGPETWTGGVRRDFLGHRLPLDLRDGYERCAGLAKAYGDLVDFWEIDNEPDLSFINENAETYAAFLKACYLGVAAGRGRALGAGGRAAEGGEGAAVLVNRGVGSAVAEEGRGDGAKLRGERLVGTGGGGPRVGQGGGRSGVLMAPLGLPAGPYFQALVDNDGLRYTDGFNYHFYGYAEDFAGMYWQCAEAVQSALGAFNRSWPVAVGAGGAVLRTKFYPSAQGWSSQRVGGFEVAERGGAGERAALVERPRAGEEPSLGGVGPWLVSDGVVVEEIPGGWRFRVERWPVAGSGALRAPVVELPLAAGWALGAGAVFSFQYRGVARGEAGVAASADSALGMDLSPAGNSAGTFSYGVAGGARGASGSGSGWPLRETSSGFSVGTVEVPFEPETRWPARELPIMLTEYGYGSLGKRARHTEGGRENQRQFFKSVSAQIAELGIEGAMAFLLRPYLEIDQQEFGLLTDAGSGPQAGSAGGAGSRRWGDYGVSPALVVLLEQAERSFQVKRWKVATPAPTSVVIDFVAGRGLGMAKSYGGYFLEGTYGREVLGEGELVVYNLGLEAKSGALVLGGEAWNFLDGQKRRPLRLEPGERRVVPVRVGSSLQQFVASPVEAWFLPSGLDGVAPKFEQGFESAEGRVGSAVMGNVQGRTEEVPWRVAPMPAEGEPLHMFEPYFRTENGNLYEAGARLVPVDGWQTYHQAAENFGPAFFGRLHLPWRFLENRPVSLVFHFHPAAFPAVFEVRHAQVARFAAPTKE